MLMIRNTFFGIVCSLFSLTATTTLAQLVPYANADDYKIARVDGQQVCVMTIETDSVAAKPMIYSFYATPFGQRWHVIGYAAADDLGAETVDVTVSVDDQVTLARSTQAQDGDFMLPFENLSEIEGHEDALAEGDNLTIAIAETQDSLTLGLDIHRFALRRMQDCLDAI